MNEAAPPETPTQSQAINLGDSLGCVRTLRPDLPEKQGNGFGRTQSVPWSRMSDERAAAQRTLGSVALAKAGHSGEQIARVTGAKYSTVNNWLMGHRKPGRAMRLKLLDQFAIPEDDWDKPIDYQPPGLMATLASTPIPPRHASAPPVAVELVPTGADVRGELYNLLEQVKTFRHSVQSDPVLTLSEKAKVLGSCGATLGLLYRMTGGAADIPESKILKLPSWQRVERAIVEALEPWPEALRAVGEALKGLDS